MAGTDTVTLTDANWDVEVLQSNVPVLVDFWAEWCGPCRMIAPIIEQIAAEYRGKVKVGKLNVDENPSTAMRYNIRGIPTLLLFKNGQVAGQLVGAVPKSEIKKLLESVGVTVS